MSHIELNPSKSLQLILSSDEFEVTQLRPRYTRVMGKLSSWWLDVRTDFKFLHLMSGANAYAALKLSDEEAIAIRDTFVPLGLRINFPEPSATSCTPKALQAGDSAGDAPTPVSVSPAGVGVSEVAP